MFKTRIAAIMLAAAALGTASGAQAQGGPARVGYVAIGRLYAESKSAKVADARIASEFSGRLKANQEMFVRLKKLSEKYEADAASLPEPERTRRSREVLDLDKEMQRKETVYRDDLAQRKSEEQALFSKKANVLIGQIAQQEKIDIVLFRDVLWTRAGIDITDKIIKRLDQ